MTVVSSNMVDFNRQLVAVREQNIYLDLTNNRDAKLNDEKHKRKLLNGLSKIMSLVERATMIQQNKILTTQTEEK